MSTIIIGIIGLALLAIHTLLLQAIATAIQQRCNQ